MTEKLLPCPFCHDGEPSFFDHYDYGSNIDPSYDIGCTSDGCIAFMGFEYRFDDKAQLAAMWNRRNHSPEYIAALIQMEIEARGLDSESGYLDVMDEIADIFFVRVDDAEEVKR